MLSFLILAAAIAVWRIADVAIQCVRELPRSNEDMVFY